MIGEAHELIGGARDLKGITEAEAQAFQAIRRLFAVPQSLEQLAQEVVEQGGRLSRIEEAQGLYGSSVRELEGSHRRQAQALEAFYQQQSCMEEASRQQTLLSQQHFDRHIIEPLARRIFPLIDMISEHISGSRNHANPSDAFEAAKAELVDLLESYGVELVHVVAGSDFDATTMKPVSFTHTNQPHMNRIVKTVVRPGFRRDERVLRSAMVDLYRFEESRSITALNREGENHE